MRIGPGWGSAGERHPGATVAIELRLGGVSQCIRITKPAYFAHTYCSSLFRCAFSTKEHRQIIAPETQSRLRAYMGSIACDHGMKALAGGRMDDHVRLPLSLPSSLEIFTAMRDIKSGS